MKKEQGNIALSLLLLRLSVFLVMLMWTIDKILNPGHASKVYEHFYYLSGLAPGVMYLLAGIELLILIGFLFGVYKKYTYGAVLLFHGISTLSSYKQYLSPFDGPHLLFFAAWPMLAACVALFLLRDSDVMYTLKI